MYGLPSAVQRAANRVEVVQSARRLSERGAGAQVSQVGPPPSPPRASRTCLAAQSTAKRRPGDLCPAHATHRTHASPARRLPPRPTANSVRTSPAPPNSPPPNTRPSAESHAARPTADAEGLQEAAATLFPPQLGCVPYVTPCACCPPLILQPAPHPHPHTLPLPLPLPFAFPLQALDPQVAKHQRLVLSNMVSAKRCVSRLSARLPLGRQHVSERALAARAANKRI
ncbi:unnamed protein product, partial [Iphiclides podalirius]